MEFVVLCANYWLCWRVRLLDGISSYVMWRKYCGAWYCRWVTRGIYMTTCTQMGLDIVIIIIYVYIHVKTCLSGWRNATIFFVPGLFMHWYSVCREQWIRAKYERQEFIAEVDEVKRPYTTGNLISFIAVHLDRLALTHFCLYFVEG